MNHGVQPVGCADVVADELVGYPAAKPAVPAVAVETEEVVAVDIGFGDPELADQAVDKEILHRVSPDIGVWGPTLAISSLRPEYRPRIILMLRRNKIMAS